MWWVLWWILLLWSNQEHLIMWGLGFSVASWCAKQGHNLPLMFTGLVVGQLWSGSNHWYLKLTAFRNKMVTALLNWATLSCFFLLIRPAIWPQWTKACKEIWDFVMCLYRRRTGGHAVGVCWSAHDDALRNCHQQLRLSVLERKSPDFHHAKGMLTLFVLTLICEQTFSLLKLKKSRLTSKIKSVMYLESPIKDLYLTWQQFSVQGSAWRSLFLVWNLQW